MKALSRITFAFALFWFCQPLFAGEALLEVNAVEISVARTLYLLNQRRPYSEDNVWRKFIVSEDLSQKTPLVRQDHKDSYTIYFSTLEELVSSVASLSSRTGRKVRLLNVIGHGLPGNLLFPKNGVQASSDECIGWRKIFQEPLNDAPEEKEDFLGYRALGETQEPEIECGQSLSDWREVIGGVPGFKSSLATDAQINFFSCLLGAGLAGDTFLRGLGELVAGDAGIIRAPVKFGFMSSYIPEGMSFFDYIDDEQWRRDEKLYALHKNDAEIAQTGAIRVALKKNGKWVTGLLPDQKHLFLKHFPLDIGQLRDLR